MIKPNKPIIVSLNLKDCKMYIPINTAKIKEEYIKLKQLIKPIISPLLNAMCMAESFTLSLMSWLNTKIANKWIIKMGENWILSIKLTKTIYIIEGKYVVFEKKTVLLKLWLIKTELRMSINMVRIKLNNGSWITKSNNGCCHKKV